jgi:hypothetical protein
MSSGGPDFAGRRFKLAQRVQEALIHIDRPFFIDNGTLLGAHRSGEQIESDDDFDFAVLCHSAEDAASAIVQISALLEIRILVGRGMTGANFRVVSSYADKIEVFEPDSGSYELEGRGGSDFHNVTVDIQMMVADGDKVHRLYRVGRPRDQDLSVVLPTREIRLCGVSFPCPADPEAYLKRVYGCIEEGAVYDEDSGLYVEDS